MLRTAITTAVLTLTLTSTPTVVSTVATPPPSSTTWSVTSATADGPDGRGRIDIDVEAGQTVQEHVAVRNLGAQTTTFTVAAADGYLTDNGRFNMLPSSQESVGAGTWITTPDTVTVAAGDTVVLPVQIMVPDNATPGDHAAGIAASIYSAPAGGSAVGVESRVGIRVILHVDGELEPAVTIDGTSVDYTTNWNPFLPGTATVQFDLIDSGNTAVTAAPSVTISGPFGLFARTTEMEPVELLPGGSRTITTPTAPVWPLGFVQSTVTVSATSAEDSGTITATPTHSSTVAVGWSQLLLLVAVAALVVVWTLQHKRNKTRLANLIEQARREGALDATR